MKKNTCVTLAVLFLLLGCAGMQPAKEASIEKVIDVPGRNKEQIYAATKIWIAENFRSAKAVIEDDDKNAGRVIGKGIIAYPCSGLSCLGKEDWKISFTMRVDIKDQKYKITFTNINLTFPPSKGSIFVPGVDRPVMQGEFDDTKPALENLGNQIYESINKEQAKANW